jgi:hypothetical protein
MKCAQEKLNIGETMEQIDAFLEHLKSKDKSAKVIDTASKLLTYFYNKQNSESITLDAVRIFADKSVAGTEDAVNKIIILFWYFNFVKNKGCSTYLLTLLGTLGVIESQKSRMQELIGAEIAETIFSEFTIPSLGSDLASYPEGIIAYMKSIMQNLEENECQRVLAGNHHHVDVEIFKTEKELFQNAESLEVFLKEKHARLVQQLSHHCETGELWFEQHITPEVVEYVKANQEIQTGVENGNCIITRKIPYNPGNWLQATDLLTKRYHACHCPFVRESILNNQSVPSLWCYCSGGFTKLFFDYLFDEDLEVKLLESAILGDQSCKFSIRLPDKYITRG